MAAALENQIVPCSILDTDLYKVRLHHPKYIHVSHPHLPADHATSRTTALSQCPCCISFHQPQQNHRVFSPMRRKIQRICIPSGEFISSLNADTNHPNRKGFTNLALTGPERTWLESTCPYFNKDYLDYLSSFRFKPEQVSINFVSDSENTMLGQIEIEATGPWVETILWEVPLMATLSETFFQTDETDWSYEGQEGVIRYNCSCSVI